MSIPTSFRSSTCLSPVAALGALLLSISLAAPSHAEPAPPAVAPKEAAAAPPAPLAPAAPPATEVPAAPPATVVPQPADVAPAPPIEATIAPAPPDVPEKPAHFFDHINVRGYTQFRYNQLAATNDRLVNLQGDRSVGQNAGMLIRRARIVLSGDLHPQVSLYFQPDFAANAGDTNNVAQIRDWYFDFFLVPEKELRIRLGQSKVPFGFENPQSSQNRLPFDRSDALNSAMPGERELGVFFYYETQEVRKRLKYLVESGLKGSGDYGMVALGVYEGQSINQVDLNENKHVVARLAYPFLFGEQYIEAGISGYTGKFTPRTDPGITASADGTRDARANAYIVIYPQPFGFAAEYNIGVGPELVNLTATTDAAGETTYTGEVESENLHGGYVLASFKIDTVIPYVRVMNYEGGKKQERNAPHYSIRELEAGVEWQVIKPLELTAAWTIARRTDGGGPPYDEEKGSLIRLQAQVNY